MVLEGPIGKVTKEKAAPGSYVFSAKHSLLDYTSKSLYPKVNDGNGLPFNFTDLYGKVTFTSESGSKVSFFGFHNQDSVNYSIADLNWQASGGGMNFLLIPSGSPVFIRGHVNGSNFMTTFAEDQVEPRYSKIGGFDLGFDFSYFLKNEGEMNYGFNFPKGTWVISMKVNNDEIWNKVKLGEVKGFSIEGYFADKYEMSLVNDEQINAALLNKAIVINNGMLEFVSQAGGKKKKTNRRNKRKSRRTKKLKRKLKK
jgi:hypothetical protein